MHVAHLMWSVMLALRHRAATAIYPHHESATGRPLLASRRGRGGAPLVESIQLTLNLSLDLPNCTAL